MKRYWIAGGMALILAAAGGIMLARRAPKPVVPAAPAPVAPAEINLVGRVEPRNTVAVAAPIAGALETWFVEPGQEVYQDQLLGRIRSPELEAAIQKAQFELDQSGSHIAIQNAELLAAKLEVSRAEADQTRAHNDIDITEKAYTRQKGLWDAGATPRLAFEKAESDFKNAKASLDRVDAEAKRAAARAESLTGDIDAANRAVADKTRALEQAKAALTSGDIHSPADGVVISRKGNIGDAVDPAMKDLVQIATELTAWQVVLPVRANVHAGQTASVHVGDQDFPGTVREVTDAGMVVDFTSANPITKLDLSAQVRIK